MVSKETALKNYISVLKFIMEEYENILQVVFSNPCINYDNNNIFNEKDNFKIVLKWNTFFRRNMKVFYSRIVEDQIDYFESLIIKNKFDNNKFEIDLQYFKDRCQNFNSIYSKIEYISESNINLLNINDTIKNTLFISNQLKHIQFRRDWLMSNLDFKHPKLFFMPNVIKNKAENLYHNAPNIMKNRDFESHLRFYFIQKDLL